MLHPRLLRLLLVSITTLLWTDVSHAQTRVACLGDSITFGHGAGETPEDIAFYCYPSQLGRLLGYVPGDAYEVQGFGASGHTLRPDGAMPYAGSRAFARGLAFRPDVAIVMLGTNDSHRDEEGGDWGAPVQGRVTALVAALRQSNPDVRVLLASPPGIFPGLPGLDDERAANLRERQPRLEAISEALRSAAGEMPGVDFVDMGSVLRPRDVTDGVHPNAFGAERIAYRLASELLGAAATSTPLSEPSVWPMSSAEYRGQSAGWGGGTWRTAFESLQRLEQRARSEPRMHVVFLGDSITQSLTGHTNRFAVDGGSRAFDRYQGKRRAVSLGLSGDRTEHLLYRIEQGSLDGFRPHVIVLQIGINNINAAGHTAKQTFDGIVAVVEALRTRLPTSEVMVTGPFPAGADPLGRVRQSVKEVHALLASHQFDPRVRYLDLSESFIDEEGQPRPTLGRDSLHITDEGREAWMGAIEPLLTRFTGVPAREGLGERWVVGRLVDEADGLPLPGLGVHETTEGWTRASGRTGLLGGFVLLDRDGREVELPPGEIVLTFQQGQNWLEDARRTVTIPIEGVVPVRIGPTYFLDLPAGVPTGSEDLECVVFGPGDDPEGPVTRWNGVSIELVTELHGWVEPPPWIRLPEPLDVGEHSLRVRWGDPLLEARAPLPFAAGRYQSRVALELAPLGVLDFTAAPDVMPRSQPFFLRPAAEGAPVIRRTLALRSEGGPVPRWSLGFLEPGQYEWELGFGGAFGSGSVEVLGGERVEVRVGGGRAMGSRNLPLPATEIIPLDTRRIPGLQASDFIAGATPVGYKLSGASPGIEVVENPEGDGFLLEIDRLGPGSWVVGVGVKKPGVAQPYPILVEEGVPMGTLEVVPLAPRRTLSVRCVDAEGNPSLQRFSVAFREGNRTFLSEPRGQGGGQTVTIEVPSDRVTVLSVWVDNHGQSTLRYDPEEDGETVEIEVDRGDPYRAYFRVEDLAGKPLVGVSIDRGGERLGVTDELGHLWFEVPPKGPDGLIVVGAANPELELFYPHENGFDLSGFEGPLITGLPIRMRRRR